MYLVVTLHIYRNIEEVSRDHGIGKQNSANVTLLLKIKVFILYYLVDKMIIVHKVILIKTTLQIYYFLISLWYLKAKYLGLSALAGFKVGRIIVCTEYISS